MMTEIRKIFRNAKVDLGGIPMKRSLILDEDDWFLIGFTANEKAGEDWSGFHNENVLIVVTEASGVEEEVFESIEGLLTGVNAKELIIFNPLRTVGFAYNSTSDKRFVKHALNCLNAPNVRAGSMKFIKNKNLIPGQVDYAWVKDKVEVWCKEIEEENYIEGLLIDANTGDHSFNFKFEGKYYQGSDTFAKRVMGEFPKCSEDVLIPAAWVDAAFERYRKSGDRLFAAAGDLRLGADIAGLGIDSTVFAHRRGDIIGKFEQWFQQDLMVSVGKINKTITLNGGHAYIDSIGEGSGVHSRCKELKLKVTSVKGSCAADKKDVNGKVLRKLTDYTNQLTFANMKSYMLWSFRDALNPANKRNFMIEPNDDFKEEATNMTWRYRSNGDIIIDVNEELKKTIGRSPDLLRAAANTFFPHFKSVVVHQQARSRKHVGFYG